MGILATLAKAVGTLTLSGLPLNTETTVIGGKTYTWQDTLTDVDGNVHIGADAEACIDNLVAAITLSGGVAGTDYAASMTLHPDVTAVKASASTMTVTSKVTGTVGNFIPTTETLTNGSFGAATLASGAGSIATAINTIQSTHQFNSDVIQSLETLEA